MSSGPVLTAILLATARDSAGGPAAALPWEGTTLLGRLRDQLARLGAGEAHLITRTQWVPQLEPALAGAHTPVRLHASDDLAGGRSTFMVEMTEAASILNNATPRSLVLVDEIGRGTSTFDGLALAYAIARHLAEVTRCYTLFATHYFELTQLEAAIPNVANVHLDAVEHRDRIVFLHRLEGGPADRSYGIHVAHLAGIPKDVVRAARRHLAELERQLRPGSQQSDLFTAAGADAPPTPPEDALRGALDAIQPDVLSPREALEAIYRLKKLADD